MYKLDRKYIGSMMSSSLWYHQWDYQLISHLSLGVIGLGLGLAFIIGAIIAGANVVHSTLYNYIHVP